MGGETDKNKKTEGAPKNEQTPQPASIDTKAITDAVSAGIVEGFNEVIEVFKMEMQMITSSMEKTTAEPETMVFKPKEKQVKKPNQKRK